MDRDNNLLHLDGWKRLRHYANNKKKLARLMRQVHLNSTKNEPRTKFGVRIPRNHADAMEFDRNNGKTKWADAEKLYLNQIYEYKSFE